MSKAMFGQYDFRRIQAFYAARKPAIMAAPKNEGAFDPYAWDSECGISLTPIEEAMWADIRTTDLVLYPQYPAHGFFLDFANPKAKVCIECDGEAFHKDAARDARRDQRLCDAGWTIYRIKGRDCVRQAGQVTPGRLLAQHLAEFHGISRSVKSGVATWDLLDGDLRAFTTRLPGVYGRAA